MQGGFETGSALGPEGPDPATREPDRLLFFVHIESCVSSCDVERRNNHVNLKYLHSPKENVNGRDCAEDPSVKFLQEARTDQPITRLPSHRNGGFSDRWSCS